MDPLRKRFEAFVKTLDGFESIDSLLRGNDREGKRRADYLFAGRSVIVEQKSLDVDPVNKPQEFFNDLVRERGILIYGKVSSKQILSKLADGDELQRKLILRITRVIDENVAKADKQTRDTRDIFDIGDATGILVVLNEKAHTLDPELIAYRLGHAFQKKNSDGSWRYPHNDGVILLSEAHPVQHPRAAKAFPIMSFIAPHHRRQDGVSRFADDLMARWAAFNNAPLFFGEWKRS